MKRVTFFLTIVLSISTLSSLAVATDKKACTRSQLISLNKSAIDFNKNRELFLRFLIYVNSSNEGIVKSIKSNNFIEEEGYRVNYQKASTGAKDRADKALKNKKDIRQLLTKCKSGYGVDYSSDYGFLRMNKEIKGVRFPSFKIPGLVVLPSNSSPTPTATTAPSPKPSDDPFIKCQVNPSIYDTDCFDLVGDRLSSQTAADGEKFTCVPYVDCKLGSLGPGGGIVFYDSGSAQVGARYREVAPVRWQRNKTASNWIGRILSDSIGVQFDPGSVWCVPKSELIKSTATVIFNSIPDNASGLQHNQILLDNCLSGAAHLARDYRGGGKTDWYLPTNLEMTLLIDFVYEHQKPNYRGLRPYFDTGYYWTSNTAKDGYAPTSVYAGSLKYNQGKLSLDPLRDWEKTGALVRPIRRF